MALRTVTGMHDIEKEQKVAEAKRKGGGGVFLILKGGESRKLYFLHEPEKATGYYEHAFDDPDGAGFQYLACQEDGCPFCANEDDRISKNTYRVAYMVMPMDEKKAYILKANTDLNPRIINRFKNRSTLIDRPYLLSRTGDGFDTKYDLDAEDGRALPDNAMAKLGVEDPVKYVHSVLQGRLDNYFGDGTKEQAPTAEDVKDLWDEEKEEPSTSDGKADAPKEEAKTGDGKPW